MVFKLFLKGGQNKMLTRKDFKKVAEILKRNLGIYEPAPDLVIEFCDWFREENPNFDEDKFREAIFGKE
jgi:hypothetical protein